MQNTTAARDRKVVLFLSHTGDLYGAERCLLDLVGNLSAMFYPIVVMPHKGLLLGRLSELSIEALVVPFRGWWFRRVRLTSMFRILFNAIAVARLIWMVRHRDVCLVYSNTSYSPVGLIVAKLLSVPHICHIHEFPNLYNFDFGVRLSMRILNWGSSVIIVPSWVLHEAIVPHCNEGKILVVNNGHEGPLTATPARRISSVRNGTTLFQILMVGSITENKGQLIALKAMRILVGKGLNVKLTFVGDVGGAADLPYLESIRRYIEETKLSERVEFAGYVPNVNTHYDASDVLVVCSKYETFGRVIIEAMAWSCPIVSSRFPAALELVIDGAEGLLYEYNDSVGLARHIEALMLNSDLRAKLTGNARRRFEKQFTVAKYGAAVERILSNQIGGEKA